MFWFSKKNPPHVVFATFKFKTIEGRDEFEGMLKSDQGLKVTRSSKGCRFIDCLQHNSNDKVIVIRQEWNSQEDHEAYFQLRKDSGMLDKLQDMLDGELVVDRFTPLFL